MAINYSDKFLFNKAWKAIDNDCEFEIYISFSDWRCKFIKKAWRLYEITFIEDNRTFINKVKFSIYGIVTPMLWGIVNHAVVAKMNVNGLKSNDGFILKFNQEK